MTIRESVARKARLICGVGFLSWLLFAGTLIVTGGHGYLILLLVSVAGFVGAVLAYSRYVICPRCGKNLDQQGFVMASILSGEANFCPSCGVSLDASL